MEVKIDLQWAVGLDGVESIDSLVFRLLSAVERGRSLRSAAKECGASYRHAWGLMQQWEQRLGAPLLKLQRGRGASLARLGRALLWSQRHAEARLRPTLGSLAAEVGHELGSLADRSNPLQLVASHDLAIELLRERLSEDKIRPFSVLYRGSMDAVAQLGAGHCDLAGYHIPDLPQSSRIEANFHRLLPADELQSIQFVDRSQGLMLPPGNPMQVRQLRDLADNGLRFLNRQAGSGTRLLFDELLARAHLQPGNIRGYEAEEFTHLAVAAMVASGAADAGFGVRAAAERFGLDFVPMVREHYLLAFRKSERNSDWVKSLLGLLNDDPDLREAISALPGYDCSGMGEPWHK